MKFYFLLYFFIVSLLFCNINIIKSQTGCNLALIRSTFTGAGCTELSGCLSSCSIYFYNPLSQTGNDAQAWAQNYGANLISVQSGAENACIVSELNANGFGGIIWIGFNDVAIEGNHVWYDQSPVTYTNWNGGEPNNSGNEDCVQIYPNGRWNDLNCGSGGSKSVIEVNLCPVTTIVPSATTVCAGANVNLPATSILGSSPFTYSWTSTPAGFTSTSASPAVTPSVTTTYDVVATDRYGCTSNASVVITVNPSPTATITGTTAVCENSSPPDIVITGAAGTAPYTFTYTINGGANQTATSSGNNVTLSVPTGVTGVFTYALVNVSDNTGCSQAQSGSATVTVKAISTAIATISGSAPVCLNNATSPGITFTGAGGTPPYTFTYTINGGSNQTISTTGGNSVTAPISTSAALTYLYTLVSVQDADPNTCPQLQGGDASVVINPLPSATISGTIDVCASSAAPGITFTGAGGTAPYTFTYTINNGASQTVTTVSGSSVIVAAPTSIAGVFSYSLNEVSDANSCLQAQNGTAIITVKSLPTATLGGTITVCQNSTSPDITFTGAAGTAPYTFTYNINGGASQTITTTGGNSAIITTPTSIPGIFIYTLVSVQDASSANCSQLQSGTATVTVNPLPTAIVSGTTVLCEGETPSNITFTGAAGTVPYTFTYRINNGLNQTVITSTGSSAVVSVPTGIAGAFIYTLVSIEDASASSCFQLQSGTATVTVNPLPTATIAGTTTVCINNPAPEITFTGASGTAPYTFTYSVNGVAQPTVTSIGNSATVSVPTGVAGIFTYALVSVRDASSTTCAQLQNGSATVTVNLLPTASISGTAVVCKNAGQPLITFTGGAGTAPYTFTYTINGGANQTVSTTGGNSATVAAPTIASGTFIYSLVSVQDASSSICFQLQSGSATILVKPLPTATIVGTIAVCKNAAPPEITFEGTGGTPPYTFTYTINNGTNQTVSSANFDSVVTIPASTTSAGAYVYALTSVQDASSTPCSQLQSGNATVTVNPLPTALIDGTASVCVNAAAPTITFTGANTIAPYTFTYSLNGGPGQTISTTSSNSADILAPTATAGLYEYTLISVQDASSTVCSQLQGGTATVTVNPNPSAGFSANDTVGCEPFCINFMDQSVITTGSVVNWFWNFGDGNTSVEPVHCYINGTIYNTLTFNVGLTVTSDSGCVSSLTRNNCITVYPNPNADFTAQPEAASIINPVITLTDASLGADFWNWNFGDGFNSLTASLDSSISSSPLLHIYGDTGTYTIVLITSTQFNCADTAYKNITILPDLVLYIPSAFSPNNDGINDTFSPKGIFIDKYEMKIFDRWGNLVFFSDAATIPWDGRANHGPEIAQQDVYIYSIDVLDIKRKKKNYKGVVTLLR